MKISAAIWGGCAVILTVAACASRKPPSGENYYVQATQEYSQHLYQPAIADYQKLIDEYPFSPFSEEAELNISLSYYKMHHYADGPRGDLRFGPAAREAGQEVFTRASIRRSEAAFPEHEVRRRCGSRTQAAQAAGRHRGGSAEGGARGKRLLGGPGEAEPGRRARKPHRSGGCRGRLGHVWSQWAPDPG